MFFFIKEGGEEFLCRPNNVIELLLNSVIAKAFAKSVYCGNVEVRVEVLNHALERGIRDIKKLECEVVSSLPCLKNGLNHLFLLAGLGRVFHLLKGLEGLLGGFVGLLGSLANALGNASHLGGLRLDVYLL